jgi:phosphoenolpyruvate-protein phosphotransferase (PTS system enzyme I)
MKRSLSSDRHSADGNTLIGIAGSPGVVSAPALVLSQSRLRYPRRRVARDGCDGEWRRFIAAVAQVQDDLRAMIDKLEDSGRAEASILEAYLLMVGDETLGEAVRGQIHESYRCADWATAAATEHLAGRLERVDDPYMRERSHDIEFVGELLVRALGGHTDAQPFALTEPAIVVAHDLSPADTAAMVGVPVAGFVTEVGARTSHTAIMARALGIPAVLGVHDALARISGGDVVILDGLRGRVVVAPSDEQVEDAERRAARHRAMTRELTLGRDVPASTRDGTTVSLVANIELPEEAALACDHGAEGVGLYRTEFLYVNRTTPPSEDEQLAVFCRVLGDMGDRLVTLRTFDIGGDKFVTTFRLPLELNPMLGLRAVRLALAERDVFMNHLRAMVRASAFGRVRILVPLVSTIDELVAVRQMLERARAEVRARGQAAAEEIPLGAMIEVPAAAIMADVFAKHADFMSIGTNDLVQYTFAIDRQNRSLAYLASPYDPAILRLVSTVIGAGAAADCPVSVCGEMASEPFGALLLVGLGLRELSMESVAIPEIKEAIRRMQRSELERVAQQALSLASAAEVERLLEQSFAPRLADLLGGQPESTPRSDPPKAARPRKTTRPGKR